MITSVFAGFVALSAAAGAAQGRCDWISENDFRSSVFDAQAALDRDDPDALASAVDTLKNGLPCIAFSPPPRLWADFLVLLALREFERDGDWMPMLAAAVAANPEVHRGVGPGHPIGQWQPDEAPPAPSGIGLRPDETWFVDGRRVTELPAPRGVHLIQRKEGPWWYSTLIIDDAAPPWMLQHYLAPPPHLALRASLVALAGASSLTQVPSWESDFIPEESVSAIDRAGGGLRATVLFFSPLGVHGDIDAVFSSTGGPRIRLNLAAAAESRILLVGLGLTARTFNLTQGDKNPLLPVVLPRAVAEVRRGPWDAEVGAGMGFSGWHAGGRLTRQSVGPFAVGGDLSFIRAHFLQGGDEDRDVRADVWEGFLLLEAPLHRRTAEERGSK